MPTRPWSLEFQYLYVPYKDQDNIGVYDSTTMRQDYYSLFSDRRFAGLDRISDSNRLSLGVTTRIYDPAGDERIRLAAAQAFDFRGAQGQAFTAAMS